jgi:hypothetical protein
MAGLSAPRIIFGIHSISPYSRSDKTPYGILKVIGSASLALNSSVDQLYGGAQRFAWAAESKTIASDMTAKVKAYPGFLFQLWLGGTVTDNAAEAGASVTTLTNFKGTSVKAAVTGVASVGVKTGSEADVKFGNFMLKATDTTHVDVYLMSDVDIGRGNAASYQNDALKITASPLAIASGADVDIPNTGLKLTGGSGTIGMTAGDTAYFRSRPINTGSSDIVIGAAASSMPAFGAVLLAQKRSTGEMVEIEAFNCIGYGMPIPMDEMAFSVTELKMVLIYDSVQDAVAKIRSVIPTTFA